MYNPLFVSERSVEMVNINFLDLDSNIAIHWICMQGRSQSQTLNPWVGKKATFPQFFLILVDFRYLSSIFLHFLDLEATHNPSKTRTYPTPQNSQSICGAYRTETKNTPSSGPLFNAPPPYNPATKRCNLCLAEKYHIMKAPRTITLNKRSELISKCRHKDKYKLMDFCIT